jgi:hypothetical protein
MRVKSVRIGGGMGFYGDSIAPALDTALSGDVQYLAFDHLAELTLAILEKDRQRDPTAGYTKDIGPLMRELLPVTHARGIRLVTNAGGLNPDGARAEVARVAAALGLRLKVAVVRGDDVRARLDELVAAGADLRNMDDGRPLADIRDRLLFANVYLGSWPIVRALEAGAEVVITGRTTDSAQFAAPIIHALGWTADDWQRMAAAVLVGHLLECGGQVTGGNFSGDWWNLPDMDRLGYPIAEVFEDGSAVIGKPPGTGGRVSVDTVKEQLLYEMHDPARYLSPDAILDVTGVRLEDVGPDRVRVTGARGLAAPSTLKALFGYRDGYMGEGIMGYAWPDALAKARMADAIVRRQIERFGIRAEEIHTSYLGYDSLHGPLARPLDEELVNEVYLRVAIRTRTREEAQKLGRLFPPLALDGPPFIGGLAGMRPVRELLGLWPTLVERTLVEPAVEVDVREVG